MTSLAALLAGGAAIVRSAVRCRRLFPLARRISARRGIPRRRHIHQAILARGTRIPGDRRRKFVALHSFFGRSLAAYRAGRIGKEVFCAPVIEGYGMTANLLIRDQ